MSQGATDCPALCVDLDCSCVLILTVLVCWSWLFLCSSVSFWKATSCGRSAWTPGLSSIGLSLCLDWSRSSEAVSFYLVALNATVFRWVLGRSMYVSWPRVSAETQIPTQRYGRRPYGVGLLIAGYDVSTELCVCVQPRVQWWILAVFVNFRTWGRTSSRPAPRLITSTVKPCRSARARSQPARTWKETRRPFWTVCYQHTLHII